VMAVVARALGCALAGKEANELLLAEGLRSDEIEEVLTHLASPALTAREQQIVAFARETVWYEPARIQQLGRHAMQGLSREEFVELVAVASIANMTCRLGILAGAA